MAVTNSITSESDSIPPVLGNPMQLPQKSLDDISIILRVVLALSEDDTNGNICKDNAELIKRLEYYRNNLKDVAKRIKEVTQYI